MERLSNTMLTEPVLWLEHSSRYLFAKTLVYGDVLDCACGIGYGSNILSKKQEVTSVTGVDLSEKAVKKATEYFSVGGKTKFVVSALENLSDSMLADCIVSFETLEHTDRPEVAVESIAKVLVKNGLFIGSVPSENYECLCESFYGANPYHLHRFSHNKLRQLLETQFKHVTILSNELRVVSFVGHVNRRHAYQHIANEDLISPEKDAIEGSYIFIASNSSDKFDEAMQKFASTYSYIGPSYIEIDKKLTSEYRDALAATEKLVQERDEYIKSLESMYEDMKESYKNEHSLLVNSLNYIEELERKLEDEKPDE